MNKVLILDFDGTIVESVDIKTEAFKEMFQESPRAAEIVSYHLENHGVSRFVKFKHIYEHFLGRKFDEEARVEAGKRFSEIVSGKVVCCPFVRGAEWFLNKFSSEAALYLVSATPHEELERIVDRRGLRSFFKAIYGSPPGTKVEHIKDILSGSSCERREAVYIGDSQEDKRSAQSTGIGFIGRRNKEDLGLTTLQFEDLAAIGKYLSQDPSQY